MVSYSHIDACSFTPFARAKFGFDEEDLLLYLQEISFFTSVACLNLKIENFIKFVYEIYFFHFRVHFMEYLAGIVFSNNLVFIDGIMPV